MFTQKDLIYISLGLFVHLLATRWPFRNIDEKRTLSLDLVGFATTHLFFISFWLFFGRPIVSFFAALPNVQLISTDLAQQPIWLLVITGLLFSDVCRYFIHRAQHSRLLWHHHAWHHSPKHLWWLSGLRATPVHVFCMSLSTMITLIFLPTVHHGPIAMGIFVFGALNQHWLHSNLSFPHARIIEKIFVTPRYHYVHHHVARKHSDTNFGFIFTFWDRLFGTYTNPDEVNSQAPLGLNYKNTPWRLIVGLPPKAGLKKTESRSIKTIRRES